MSWWCFASGSNAHIVGDPKVFEHLEEIQPEELTAGVQGVAESMATKAAGIGTVKIVSIIGESEVELFIDGVLNVPGATHGLFSKGLALEQGFAVDYDRNTREYSIFKGNQRVITAFPSQGIWIFNIKQPGDPHERKLILGKQKRKRRHKSLNRNITAPTQIVYADLLSPGSGNGTRYKAILVIMDGWSRFLTVYLLTSKEASVVNQLMQQYVLWAERQAGRGIKKIVQSEFEPAENEKFPEQRVLTDKGGEFVNTAIEYWYAARGIEHIKVGPKSSHLNPCERAHQSLIEMTKVQMQAAGFPRSFWPYALKNRVYINNRVYAKPIEGVPYQRIFGVKPDIHHIRKFGSLAYVHVPVSPEKQKQDDNAFVSFVFGYAEETVGCQVYIPSERTVKFVAEVRVQEDITYGDRHDVNPAGINVAELLTFETEPENDKIEANSSSIEGPDSFVPESECSMERVDNVADDCSEVNASVLYEFSESRMKTTPFRLKQGDGDDIGNVNIAEKPQELSSQSSFSPRSDMESQGKVSIIADDEFSCKIRATRSRSAEDVESVAAECGSEDGYESTYSNSKSDELVLDQNVHDGLEPSDGATNRSKLPVVYSKSALKYHLEYERGLHAITHHPKQSETSSVKM
ncbi:hypothetical protein PHMEG_0007031 [Phytophthora megakarya]|uniref:Integrase catalytic domain-containing protein n=1 Tax=Phytophthora megakarya TaxID=4795 RepID=A0A225WMV5_9STRA|nr:hypothetical protein PHMEG_0007031 [Phytophthora megakarya]